MTFKELYDNAMSTMVPQEPNKMVKTGNCMAIIESSTGNVYFGANIDASCGLGISAERAAIASMVTCREFEIAKMVVVNEDGSLRMPSGDSRELMLQLSASNQDAEILMDVENQKMVRLEKLLPLWWGKSKY